MALSFAAILTALLHLAAVATSVPTWPATTDELEDIMLLNTGYRAQGFATNVVPCGFSAAGPGRIAAAEWIRTAFHDMSTANTYFGQGGLDASLAYELNSGENIGAAFNTTLTTYSGFYGPRVPMSELIAIGMYTAVRACGGPIIPIRTGRVDATKAGSVGVPQPQNNIGTFQNQFTRMGFNNSEMVGLVACGHTVGGVHSVNFPQIVAPGTCPNDYCPMDTSDTVFDSRVATEFVSGTTADPLAVGISVNATRDSDTVVYEVDNNATITLLQDPTYFTNTCQSLLQRMIEVVPKTVSLSASPLAPYEAKPYNLQLYVVDSNNLAFSGEVRIRTTSRSGISSVQISYLDRNGNPGSAAITASSVGAANGFDDSFAFYSFSTTIPASTSISSFQVAVTSNNGLETFNNNGAGFPMQDTLLVQYPQSCLSSGLNIVAAVRNTASGTPKLNAITKTIRTSPVIPLLATNVSSMSAISGQAVGSYTLYSVTFPIDSTKTASARYNITMGSYASSLRYVSDLATSCSANPVGTSNSSTTASTSTTISTSMSTPLSSSGSSNATSLTTTAASSATSANTNTNTTPLTTATTTTTNTVSISTTTTSSAPSATYTYVGCYYDSVSSRTMSAKSTSSSTMTYDTCSAFCATYPYFGLEYSSECYCSLSLPANSSSTVAPDSDCNMPCSGSPSTTCGAGNRLSVFTQPAPNAPQNLQSVPGSPFSYGGCYTDSVSARTLPGNIRLNNNNMTIETCAAFCAGYVFMGLEYSSECYCGNALANSPTLVGNGDCDMVCSGNSTELCGAGNRLSLYNSTTTSSRIKRNTASLWI